ncbi:MAG: hypothetical protein DRO12_04830, partial [Thermoprotei archaeon]
MGKRVVGFVALFLVLFFVVGLALTPLGVEAESGIVVVELVFSRPITDEDIARMSELGAKIIYRLDRVNGLAVAIQPDKIELLRSVEGVEEVGLAVRIEALSEVLPSNCDLHGAVLTWNLDLVNVPTVHEVYGLDGSGVYIAVLDTGLEPQWRDYFPEESIDSEHAAAFLGATATAYWVTGEVLNKNT